MYLYVFDQNVYDELVQMGQKCLREMTDINGRKIWVFARNDSNMKFAQHEGCICTPELHMAF